MAEELPVAVIGAGIVGLATAHALVERGAAVRVYEAGAPGNGQSGGESRIFRHGHDDPRLARFVRDSRALWTDWGDRFGVELISPGGAVVIGPSVEGQLRVFEEIGGVEARLIDTAELHARVPMLGPYDGPAMVDEGGGAIRASAAIRALTGELRDILVFDEVISVRRTERGTVEVRTGGDRSECSSVIVCAGRGTSALAQGVGLSLPVRLTAHVRLTFKVRGDSPDELPCLQDKSGEFGVPGAYGTPEHGTGRYGIGLSQTVPVRPDGSLVDAGDLAKLSDRTSAYVARALPGLDPEPVDLRHCWVTDLPWNEDGVAVWEWDGIFFVAGHNLFKHAPLLGRELAGAALGDGLSSGLRPEAKLGERE